MGGYRGIPPCCSHTCVYGIKGKWDKAGMGGRVIPDPRTSFQATQVLMNPPIVSPPGWLRVSCPSVASDPSCLGIRRAQHHAGPCCYVSTVLKHYRHAAATCRDGVPNSGHATNAHLMNTYCALNAAFDEGIVINSGSLRFSWSL